MSDLIGSWSIDASKTGCVFPTMWLLETYEIKTHGMNNKIQQTLVSQPKYIYKIGRTL